MARKLKKATETAVAASAASTAPVTSPVANEALSFTAKRKDLLSVLRKLAPLAAKGSTARLRPMLATVALRGTASGVVLATTDLDTWAVYAAPAWTVHTDGAVCVDIKPLIDVLSKLADGDVTISASADRVGVCGGAAKVDLPVRAARDFPKLPPVTPDDPVVPLTAVDAGQMRRLIEATEAQICRDETRFHLNGICLEYDGTTARMISTDGHRLALAQCEMARAGDFATPAKGVILRRAACTEIRKLCKGDGVVEIGELKSLIVVRHMGLTLVTKRIDAEFPSYGQVIPHDNRKLATVDRLGLLGALKRSLPTCSDTRGVQLRVGSERIAVKASHPERGEFEESYPAEHTADTEWTIGVNPRYLIDALDALDDERVTLAFSGEMDPIVVRSTEDATQRPLMESSQIHVIMPMRI